MADPSDTTPGTGTGWVDHADDAATIALLVGMVGAQQRSIAACSTAGLDGRIDRAQHQKQLLGAFGTLSVFEALPAAVGHGPFVNRAPTAGPFAYRIACRLSNGQPCPFADTEADVRGFAIKFFTADGTETDLLMTNEGGRSHAKSAVPFMQFADVLVAQIESGAVGATKMTLQKVEQGKLGVAEAARIVAILGKETKLHHVDSLTSEHFWGSVVRLGDAAIKYALQPADAASPSVSQGAGYLRDDLLRRLESGPLKWQLCVQLFADETRTPIGDASVAWDAPLIPVGEVEIATPPSALDEERIGRMAFNPGNGFEPLGITRARRDVYAASAANRSARGLLTSEEARRLL
jgi:catalase